MVASSKPTLPEILIGQSIFRKECGLIKSGQSFLLTAVMHAK